jgi:hypothetical protein
MIVIENAQGTKPTHIVSCWLFAKVERFASIKPASKSVKQNDQWWCETKTNEFECPIFTTDGGRNQDDVLKMSHRARKV